MPFAAPTAPVEIKRVRIRLINTDERAQWDALMRTHHYLGFVALVGRSLRYIAEIDGHWPSFAGLGVSRAQSGKPGRLDWLVAHAAMAASGIDCQQQPLSNFAG